MNLLQLSELRVGYTGRTLLETGTLELQGGKVYGLLGPNGSGKSTLIRVCAGLTPALEGAVLLNNQKITAGGSRENARSVSVLLSEKPSFSYLKLEEYLLTAWYPFMNVWGVPDQAMTEKMEDCIRTFRLDHLRNRQVGLFSDGQKQLVTIARAMMVPSKAYLLDEPLNFLDLPSRRMVMNLIRTTAEKNSAPVLISGHEWSWMRDQVDQWLILAKDKKLLAVSPQISEYELIGMIFGPEAFL